MEQEAIPLRFSGIIALCVLSVLVITGVWKHFKSETIVVFCDVGQGDGAYMRIESRIDILIDAGPGNKILSCLGKYMPFYDKKVEFAFLSHPQKDHYGGFSEVLERYEIETFVISYAQSEAQSFKSLLEKLAQNSTQVIFLYSGAKVVFSESSTAQFLWPTESYVINNPHLDPNSYSQIVLFSILDTKLLFTGDILPIQQKLFINLIEEVSILKAPHHGSKNGLTKLLLDKAGPDVIVISVGKNSYGHPSESIINMLKDNRVEIRRTDKEGSILFRF